MYELIIISVVLVGLLVLFLPALLAIIDVVRSDFRRDSDRVLWAIIVLMVPVIGPILYFLIGRKQKLHA
ncbi:MAG: PLDc_N domain-containing protein [Armatimonadetes bacterium]|nr:PLDc_N domain-containing protein [Armatimonadota bacterium]